MATIAKSVEARYNVTQSAQKSVNLFYNVRPAIVELYDNTDTLSLSALFLGLIETGTLSQEFTIHLWNDKSAAEAALKMDSIVITISLADGSYSGGDGAQGQETIDEKWFEAKSSGVSGTGITDDAQQTFTPIGGDPSTGGLSTGEIINGTARHIQCRMNVPADASTSFYSNPRFEIQYTSAPYPGFGQNHGEYFGG